MTDEQLAKLAAGGDRDAMEELVSRIYPQIFRFYVKLAGPDQAQDLTQNAAIKTLENLHKYKRRNGARFMSWVLRLCYHAFIDQVRRKSPLPTEDTILASFPDRCNDYARTENRDTITRLLHQLPEDDQAMVTLRYYFDMSYREIAQILSTNETRIKWKLHAALEKMRKTLGEEGAHG